MSVLYKEYIPIKESPEGDSSNFIRISMSFNKDTYHWATGNSKPKGYQVTATPVHKGEMTESFTAFQGFYEIVYEVERQSKKRLYTATELTKESRDRYLEFFKERGYKF